ncbi:centrosomal protein 43-like [Leptinotarsa decemlineata]|uniref:centrosomal protein 43-like n=1 Tax=Leptinotarsa decemlineata TaxID=7539 RepID=UPI003D30B84D
MSEEDIELRDLVAQTLESNGTLAKIKAQLCASIFLALDEDEKVSRLKPSLNNKITNFLETEEGRGMFCVVHEFLEFFNMNFTLSVYQSESYCGDKYKYEDSQKLKDKLRLENISNTSPLLFHLLKVTQTKAKSIQINLDIRGDKEEKSASVNTESDNVKTVADSIGSEVEGNENLLSVRDISSERKFDATFSLTSPTVNLSKTVSGDSLYILPRSCPPR